MTTNNATVPTQSSKKQHRRPRGNRKGTDAAVPAAASTAADGENPKRVLAPFVPSKPGSCADCEACKLRREIAETQAKIREAWAREDRLTASDLTVSDVVRVPLTAEAEGALVQRLVDEALSGYARYDPTLLHVVSHPAAVRDRLVAVLTETTSKRALTMEDAVRTHADAWHVEYAAPASLAHLKCLLSSGAGAIGHETKVEWRRDLVRLGATLWDASPAVLVVALTTGAGGRVPVALYGAAASGLAARAATFMGAMALVSEGLTVGFFDDDASPTERRATRMQSTMMEAQDLVFELLAADVVAAATAEASAAKAFAGSLCSWEWHHWMLAFSE